MYSAKGMSQTKLTRTLNNNLMFQTGGHVINPPSQLSAPRFLSISQSHHLLPIANTGIRKAIWHKSLFTEG